MILIIRILRMRSELKSVSKQLEALVCDETEKMIDISFADKELERLAGLLNQYNDKQRMIVAGAKRDEENLKDSVANISHDLRTPLTVMLGHLQLIDKTGLDEEQARRIDIVISKAVRMKELVETFYEYSLINASESELKPEKINVSNLLIDLISENAPAMEEKGIVPTIDLPSQSVFLYSDRNALDRIFQNLLTNAIRYSAGNIGVKLSASESEVLFTISNPVEEGSTIDASRLFDRFYTGDRSRHSGSTGLGLAVVKELTNKLGGSADARCEENELTIEIKFSV